MKMEIWIGKLIWISLKIVPMNRCSHGGPWYIVENHLLK